MTPVKPQEDKMNTTHKGKLTINSTFDNDKAQRLKGGFRPRNQRISSICRKVCGLGWNVNAAAEFDSPWNELRLQRQPLRGSQPQDAATTP